MKQLASVGTPTVQTPVWLSQDPAMQLVQVVAVVLQVAQGDVHATQAAETKVYPEAHAVQVLGDATMAAHGMVEAPPATTEKPRLAVTQMAAVPVA